MKQKFVVIEYDISNLHDEAFRGVDKNCISKPKEISVVFGPFDSKTDANDFCNRRIAILSSEWFAKEDGAIIDHIAWEVRQCNSVK